MNSWKIFAVIAFVAAMLFVGAAWFSWKPTEDAGVPRATLSVPTSMGLGVPSLSADEAVTVEGGTATSENYMLISSPPTKK
ncbi:hypothetical protein HZC53_03760 [Candidatus Uhrbacteria bacterium]|nr:hypothetical protein [Candidatus Uhrbacteria bacterium]